jgi:hypothetical protein
MNTVLKSVARIRRVKNDNPNMCVTVNSDSSVLPVVPSCVYKLDNKFNHNIQTTSIVTNTLDNTIDEIINYKNVYLSFSVIYFIHRRSKLK